MTEKEAITQAMKLCSKKEYASGDIFKKLRDWDLSEEIANRIIKELIKDKFIDDKRFTQAYVNDKLKFSKWGKIKISYMLKQKEVPNTIISEALNVIDKDTYEETLYSELKKKIKSIKATNKYELKSKLIQFALNRGFEYEIGSRIAEKLL